MQEKETVLILLTRTYDSPYNSNQILLSDLQGKVWK